MPGERRAPERCTRRSIDRHEAIFILRECRAARMTYCSENDMSMGGALMLLVRESRGNPDLRAGESRDA
jgi:hypothetical protein